MLASGGLSVMISGMTQMLKLSAGSLALGVLPRHGARLTLEKAQALCCWMKCSVQEMSYL